MFGSDVYGWMVLHVLTSWTKNTSTTSTTRYCWTEKWDLGADSLKFFTSQQLKKKVEWTGQRNWPNVLATRRGSAQVHHEYYIITCYIHWLQSLTKMFTVKVYKMHTNKETSEVLPPIQFGRLTEANFNIIIIVYLTNMLEKLCVLVEIVFLLHPHCGSSVL